MKVTFIIQDKTEKFYSELAALPDNKARFEFLKKQEYKVTKKEGNGSFRDRVELNQLIRSGKEPEYKLEPRRGYKLATFIY